MKTFRLKISDKVVVLTGAGVSAESGLKTFRDNNGLWEKNRVEDVATPEAFQRDPAMVWSFYKQRYWQLDEVQPNQTHIALVELEKYLDYFRLITQNVDGLHKSAGNKNIWEMHGTLDKACCSKCNSKFAMNVLDLEQEIPICPVCGASARPDIIWFGEMPYFMDEIHSALQEADYFIMIGTSGMVYPAAQFIQIAKHYGAKTVCVNLEKPENNYFADYFYQGKSGEILPKLVAEWIK